MKKINVALVGLGFGGAFAQIYKQHPNVGELTICDTNPDRLRQTSDYLGGARCVSSLDAILADPSIDAVHLVTPIPLHAEQSVAVLEAGKHCACTVPMPTSLDDIRRIVQAKRKSGKHYMMMETTLYTYQFFYVRQMLESGELGRIQFLRGSHYQDMANWPDYWMGLPPMWYGTHAIAPMVALSGSRICRVNCFGSGTMDPALVQNYGNPFPVESALFEFENGLKKCFEWGFADWDEPLVSTLDPGGDGRNRWISYEKMSMPNYYADLPEALRHFTVGDNYDPLNPQDSLKKGAGAGHHGAHAHLVHEFVMSCIENRTPDIDEQLGGNITAAGICAHTSALKNGEPVLVPKF